MVSLVGPRPEVFETGAHVFVVGSLLDVNGAELSSDAAGRPPAGESIRELPVQILTLLVEEFGADVRVQQVAVRDVELLVALVEAAAGVGGVFQALELVLVEVGAGEGDEAVEEGVVEVREGFEVRVERVGGHGDAGAEDLVCGGRGAWVVDDVHEGEGFGGVGIGEGIHCWCWQGWRRGLCCLGEC